MGLARICLDDPTLILCQIADSRTYNRTLAKLSLFNPVEILVPLSSASAAAAAAADGGPSKLYGDIDKYCPAATVQQLQRKYFGEARGLQVGFLRP